MGVFVRLFDGDLDGGNVGDLDAYNMGAIDDVTDACFDGIRWI